ncbi:pyridoxal 5'-phosphate synthase glutaminase subunit PdxT [Treponema sp.]|uniref:pyridoxal 5'-phosphate synthase glutaminase subunit PdxT n=1 Tax=Treponema sp. TaxID=166 RepID=UPI00298DE90F|nr:pyridoxal 5'-phosphate synthase glutaminase subunit PdxT [Treponema sp.]MCQ2241524.1 pyridoxal 5'-phosphate synthase glutaminase subunit PdxT [Treponema sp.]
MMTIGVLAVQGAFIEHEKMVEKLGYQVVELRNKNDICNLDGLILPGGESTVQGKLIKELGMFDQLKELIEGGLPVLGTCAGLILLSRNISNDEARHFQTLPVTVERNAYGRQLGSFRTTSAFGFLCDVEMTFIRAPVITAIGEDVKVLSRVDEKIVAVEYKNQMGISFHPELGEDTRVLEYFLQKCRNFSKGQ